MKKLLILGLVLGLLLATAPTAAADPIIVHLGPGTITSTSLATYGTTWGPANDYWFDLSAGLKVTIVGLNMGQIPYTGAWKWPPTPGEDGGSAQLWVYDGHWAWSRHDLTSAANAGGTWDAQSTWASHDQGFRKYLVQNFRWSPLDWASLGGHQYNVEPWKGPRLNPGPNIGSNMGTPNPESDKFDLEYTYVPGVGSYTVSGRVRMHYAASWDEMSLPKPPWPLYKWQWNKAINNVATPDAAWLPFYEGSWKVPEFCGPANLRMAFQNRGVPQSGYWTISWDDIVVVGTLGDHVGPVASSVVAAPNPVGVGVPIDLTAVVDDSTTGNSTIASAEYSIDGGTWVPMSAQDGAFDEVSEGVSATLPAFSETGVHNICVRGTDAHCNSGESIYEYIVVYDPGAGFVTGGGWIMSPAGAYVANPTLTGKATFGFVSKYQKGANVPTGNTEFQFKAGNLNFHSTSYDWLVVAGARAQFKGTGTINGAGEYRFMLTAIDGAINGGGGVDKFRIKIWDASGLVYDNQMGASDTADPTTALGGGSIVIHK